MTIHGGPSFEEWQIQKRTPAGTRRFCARVKPRIDALLSSFDALAPVMRSTADAFDDFGQQFVQASRLALTAVPAPRFIVDPSGA